MLGLFQFVLIDRNMHNNVGCLAPLQFSKWIGGSNPSPLWDLFGPNSMMIHVLDLHKPLRMQKITLIADQYNLEINPSFKEDIATHDQNKFILFISR